MNTEILKGFYLGDFLVEPLKGQVTGRSGSAHLPPKAMEVLVCLAESPDEITTRQHLLDHVWGEGHGSQEALNHAVGDIRRALDDHADNPGFIQTLPKRGYRLLVTPEIVAETTSSVVLGTDQGARITDIGFLENLQQRGVLETGIAYLLVGWLLIQIGDVVFDQLLLPDWVGTFVTVLVIAGFPIALTLSWYLEFRDGRAIVDERTAAEKRRRRFSRTYLSVIGALVVAGGLVYVYDQSVGLPKAPVVVAAGPRFDASKSLPPVKDNSIAVLPFFNTDGSETTQIFANGLAEDVISRLSRVPELLVSSRGDAFSLNANTPSARVRERLRVAKFVAGSVQIAGDEMRVTVNLIDSKTGSQLLSRTFDRPLSGFFEMRDKITELAVANFRVALPPATREAPTGGAADPDIGVYVLYRRGVEATREPDIDGWVDEALHWFDSALTVDDEFAAAFAGKCDVHVKAYPFDYDASHIEAGEAACARALRLNPNLDVVYASLGDLRTATGEYDGAEAAYLDALKIDPNNASALMGLGEVYRLQQRPEDAEASLRRAIGLHPGDWAPYNALGTFLFRSGRYAEAAEQYRTMVSLDDTNNRGLTNLASALVFAEDFSAAEPVFQRAIDLEPKGATYMNFGMLLYIEGRFDEAVEAHRRSVILQPQDYLARSNFGDALWAAGKRSEALEVFGVAKDLALDALQVNPNDAFILMDLAWINTNLGEDDEARSLMARAMGLVPDDPYVHYLDGLILNRRGKTTDAIKALGKAIELGYSPGLLKNDPNIGNLRDDVRFQGLLNTSK